MAETTEGATNSILARYNNKRKDSCSRSSIPILRNEFENFQISEPAKTIIRQTVFGTECFCNAVKGAAGVPADWVTALRGYSH